MGRVEALLSATMQASARRAWWVVAVVALVTAASVFVLATVQPEVETDVQAGYFATHDDQANAFRSLRRDVAGVNSEIVYFELRDDAEAPDADDPRCAPAFPSPSCPVVAVDNVTSMEALRAQDELFAFVKAEFVARTAALGLNGSRGVDKILSYTGLPYFEKLIHAQFPDGCYCLAPDEPRHDLVQELLGAADSTGAIALYRSADFRSAVMFIIYDPDTTHLSKKETGGLVNEIIAAYREMDVGDVGEGGVPKTYDLWEEAYLDSWGVQSWIFRIDEQVQEETPPFILAVFAFLAATLVVLFRNVRRALIGVATVAVILTWTLAGMTLGGVAVGFVSMAMFPLLLGVGVDYVIHVVNEFGVERARTGSSHEAFGAIGRRGAVALLISSLTTITGFVVMITSTSPMIVEIGTATVLGILSIFLLSMTLLPALLQLTSRNDAREVLRASKGLGALAAATGRARVFVILALLAGTVLLGSMVPRNEYVIGTVEVNLPQKEVWTHRPDRAHMLDMYERFQQRIEATGQETVITQAQTEGGLATRAAVDDMIAIHRAMVDDAFVQGAGGAVNSVPFILNLYALLQDGIMSAAPGILGGIVQGGQFLPCDELAQTPDLPQAPIPDLPAVPGLPVDGPPEPSQIPCGIDPDYQSDFALIEDWSDADIRAAYDDMLAREAWAPLLLTFMDRTYSIAWALTFVNIPIDQEAAHKADQAFQDVLEAADPQATDNHYFGTLTGIKKYNDYTDFWLAVSTAASLVVVALLVALFTRSVRAVAAVVVPMALTLTWWLGLLPLFDIDLAFIFMIPIAFITSLGSDYAVHLAWNLERRQDRRFVHATVGKAVAYSGFTTAFAFLVFTRGAIRGSYEMFQAAVIAIVLMAVLTLAIMPLFYPPGRTDEEDA